jgi:hypothetical protein
MLRDSHPRSSREFLQKLWFISPLRCLDCRTRFVASTLILADLKFARCPTCYRMDLSTWTARSCTPPLWTSLKISLGAARFRCEYCRVNFASFRRRKESFTWKKGSANQARTRTRKNDTGDELT